MKVSQHIALALCELTCLGQSTIYLRHVRNEYVHAKASRRKDLQKILDIGASGSTQVIQRAAKDSHGDSALVLEVPIVLTAVRRRKRKSDQDFGQNP